MGGSLIQVFRDMNLWSALAAVVDVAIVAYVLYRFLLLIRGTRAVQLIRGLVVLLLAATIAEWFQFNTIQWILDKVWAAILVALVVVFQPELRRALEQIGRAQFFTAGGIIASTPEAQKSIQAITRASTTCSKNKTGMLIVIEQNIGLKDYIETGITLDSEISEGLLVNIFEPNTPLHDGATIIKGNRVAAAACFLPLSDNPYISMSLGTRHRAAIGLSEVSDAVIIVVSEETGIISVAKEGKLVRSLDESQLKRFLEEAFMGNEQAHSSLWQRMVSK